MGELILVGLLIYWLATNTAAALWVLGILIVLGFIGLLTYKPQKPAQSKSSERPRIRIAHPHYIDDDDYECTICGRRFEHNQMSCPHCGVRFTETKEDYEEYEEEEDELDYWDEEDGC